MCFWWTIKGNQQRYMIDSSSVNDREHFLTFEWGWCFWLTHECFQTDICISVIVALSRRSSTLYLLWLSFAKQCDVSRDAFVGVSGVAVLKRILLIRVHAKRVWTLTYEPHTLRCFPVVHFTMWMHTLVLYLIYQWHEVTLLLVSWVQTECLAVAPRWWFWCT